MTNGQDTTQRRTVFISKATPEDDEFVCWLAPKLEAAGYQTFADILTLEPGDRWRKVVTNTLQRDAIKMLLCCRDSSLAKDGVQEEIGIASDLVKDLGDPRFIIPLRLEPFKKLFGIGELQYVNFSPSWAHGLHDLLDTLEEQKVPRDQSRVAISPNWENYRRRLAIAVENEPEVLTSNWLRILSFPKVIRYYQPSGAVDHTAMTECCRTFKYPAQVYLRGFFTFASPEDVERDLTGAGRFLLHSEHAMAEFLENGAESPDIRRKEARNLVSSLLRTGWERLCRGHGLLEYAYSNQLGFHATAEQAAIGKRVRWGSKKHRRSAMLRNIAAGKVWQYGVSASFWFWPVPHFRLKARVLFSELAGKEVGTVLDDTEKQHRFRRSVCKGWRNKQWHGRLMVFCELLSGGSGEIELPVSNDAAVILQASPLQFTAPVTTIRPDDMPDDAEEQDESTLGNVFVEEVE